jgi:DNA-binding NarL/FixJ family response regulator
MTIRIIIADDHGVVAEGLKHVVETQPDMEVVSLAVDGRDACGRRASCPRTWCSWISRCRS